MLNKNFIFFLYIIQPRSLLAAISICVSHHPLCITSPDNFLRIIFYIEDSNPWNIISTTIIKFIVVIIRAHCISITYLFACLQFSSIHIVN